jgi:hypothetical protein
MLVWQPDDEPGGTNSPGALDYDAVMHISSLPFCKRFSNLVTNDMPPCKSTTQTLNVNFSIFKKTAHEVVPDAMGYVIQCVTITPLE